MRVWGSTDPRMLGNKHLLGEHLEIHTLISGGWKNHPESLVKRFDNDISWLILRHELLRWEMACRYGSHHIKEHGTPVDYNLLNKYQSTFFKKYIDDFIKIDEFAEKIHQIGFPPTKLEHDTPWDREDYFPIDYEKDDRWQ